jgi:hypothetical protein
MLLSFHSTKIVSQNASAVKICNATSSLVRFEARKKNIFSTLKQRSAGVAKLGSRSLKKNAHFLAKMFLKS